MPGSRRLQENLWVGSNHLGALEKALNQAFTSRSRARGSFLLRLALAEEFVVQDRSSQHRALFRGMRLLRADQPSLAEHGAVFLAGDFLRHLENHFDKRIGRQLLRSIKQHAGLADVLNYAFKPGAQIFDPEADGTVQLQAAR